MANNTYPADFLSENLQIQVNLLDAAVAARVPRLLFLGSSCIYPKYAPQPIKESALLTGPLEPTNDAYAIAKIAGILQVQAVRRQYGLAWISAMPTNLYGPGDNFSPTGSHLLPALIRRYEEAKASGAPEVTNWGTGTPRRELLHVDDLASACLFLLEHFDGPNHVNVGTGIDHTISEIAEMVAKAVGYTGETRWDSTKPDGTPRKLLECRFCGRRDGCPKSRCVPASRQRWRGIARTSARQGNECAHHDSLFDDAPLASQPWAQEAIPLLDSSPGGRTATGTSGWCSESEPLRADNRG